MKKTHRSPRLLQQQKQLVPTSSSSTPAFCFTPFQIPETLDSIPRVDVKRRVAKIEALLHNNVHHWLMDRGEVLASRKDPLTRSECWELFHISSELLTIGGEMILCRVGEDKVWRRVLKKRNLYGKLAYSLLFEKHELLATSI